MSGARPTTLTGGCLCGAVRYRVHGAPLQVGVCHCSLCRRNTGAVYATLAVYAADQLVIERGEQAGFDTRDYRRYFCRVCGSSTYMAHHRENELELHVGSLDDAEALAPSFEEWTEVVVPWVPRDPRWMRFKHSRT